MGWCDIDYKDILGIRNSIIANMRKLYNAQYRRIQM